MNETAVPSTYDIVIGLEVHAQCMTVSKMFCGCSARYIDAGPNENTCPVCLGMPGVLPVMNEEAVRDTILTGLALDCTIPSFAKFDRKNYFYADLPKGYQISQFDMPFAIDGTLSFLVGDRVVTCGIERVHLEEDAGTLHHLGTAIHTAHASLVDFNRAGVPLMEIVSRPDLRTPDEAREYVIKLRQILMYIGVNDGNLDEGSMRCDANISLKPPGQTELGAKVEIKNMNSFRSIVRALEYEIIRQTAALDNGEEIPQETRGWVDTEGITVSQRSKEAAHDYRYFPEPDLPPVTVDAALMATLRSRLPELPDATVKRLETAFGLTTYDARVIAANRDDVRAYEDLVNAGVVPLTAARWYTGDIAKLANEHHLPLAASGLGIAGAAALLRLVDAGTINGATAKGLLEKLYIGGGDPVAIVNEQGLGQVSDRAQLEQYATEAIAHNPKAAEDYRNGKEAAIQSLVGYVMKQTRGRADAKVVTELLSARLKG